MTNPVTEIWGARTPAGGTLPDLDTIFTDFERSIAGRYCTRFATRNARNSATSAFLTAYPNQRGMLAYCDDLETVTIYTPHGWKFLSPLYYQDTFFRNYFGIPIPGGNPGGASVADTVSGPLTFSGLPPDAYITITTHTFCEVDGGNDQTFALTFDTTGATRQTPDPLLYRERIIGHASPSELAWRPTVHIYQATSPSVSFLPRWHTGGGSDRIVVWLGIYNVSIRHSRNPAA